MSKVLILGVGAIGSNLVINLLYDIPTIDISVLDFDVVESRNISAGTQVYSQEQIGLPKVKALSILAYNRNKKIHCISQKLTENNLELLYNYDLVIDCFDNSLSRKLVYDFCLSKNIPCVHLGISPISGEICWNQYYHVPEDISIDICSLAGARSFIQFFVGFASLIIQNFLNEAIIENYFVNKFSIIKF